MREFGCSGGANVNCWIVGLVISCMKEPAVYKKIRELRMGSIAMKLSAGALSLEGYKVAYGPGAWGSQRPALRPSLTVSLSARVPPSFSS